jgi:hypothetical protein
MDSALCFISNSNDPPFTSRRLKALQILSGPTFCNFLLYIDIVTYIIVIYIQQDATLHSLFYLKTALHVLGGTITHHQERIQLYLQHLVFVTPLLLSAAIAIRCILLDIY